MDITIYIMGSLVVFCGVILFLLWRSVKKKDQIIQELQEDLQKSNKQVISSSRESEHLLSIISHDLKSPLNRVFALSGLLKMDSDKLTEDHKDYITKIQLSVSEGLHLMRNLMDLRNIEKGEIGLNFSRVELGSVVKGVIRGNELHWVVKNIEVKQDIPEDAIYVESDKQYLERILDNLVSNAIKFTPHDRKVEISVIQGAGEITISITDEGPGIKEEESDLLFEKYVTLSASPTGDESAHGLGLAVAKDYSERIGAKLGFESDERGSTFYLSLPLEKASH